MVSLKYPQIAIGWFPLLSYLPHVLCLNSLHALQQAFTTMTASGSKVDVSKKWDVLGPFPIHAREQQYISPAFPLNLSEPIDYNKLWPSSYADGGNVGWKTVEVGEDDGNIYAISKGGQLCSTMRFSGRLSRYTGLQQMSAKWYAGNIYDISGSLPQIVELPLSRTGEYQLFISGDYEIRLFGDPVTQEGSDVPVQKIILDLQIEDIDEVGYALEPAQNVICDFVDGYAFGDSIGIGLRNTGESWISVDAAKTVGLPAGLEVQILKTIRIAPGQTRVIPLKLRQLARTEATVLDICLTVTGDQDSTYSKNLTVSLPIHHTTGWTTGSESRNAVKASFLFANSSPTIFVVIPPRLRGQGQKAPPILSLHGAGVDITYEPHFDFWVAAQPQNDYSWIILPAGRTSWGLDWHGPSTKEALDAVEALSEILQSNDAWKHQAFRRDTKVILIGHSNGGQGVWHISTHYPDRIIAGELLHCEGQTNKINKGYRQTAAPTAGYIKSQAYIPLTESRSAHFIDPSLRAILESSLTPDDNDLHLTNAAHLPIQAIHGHYQEDPGEKHWYSTVLNNTTVQDFIDAHIHSTAPQGHPSSFSLTVSNPTEAGSLYGWKIHSLTIPGRLGTLRITTDGDGLARVSTTNVLRFSIEDSKSLSSLTALTIASTSFPTGKFIDFPVHFVREKGVWTTTAESTLRSIPPTRIQTILSTLGTINIFFDGEPALSLAKRLAHDLHLYHRLDAEILGPAATEDEERGGNSVVIGTLQSPRIRRLLETGGTSFNLRKGTLSLDEKEAAGDSHVFLHPGSTATSYKLVIIYSDVASLERAGRLFPIRTGVAVPDWLSLSPGLDRLGAAGLRGAGVWDTNWRYQESSSWLDNY
ncbi:hypothetical protein D9611_004528 [Ephemerocybe angulata]|uniref:Peptidase S9 prolyl oligopeptidase catalytic domain-containing protein n=1 Tax=Ephemerocybe angulata TaxID=980116 RepID=A0A8H5BJX2_9AGAR|nr:hypothetical protein D9611_004528 [Tulosesus angulatus]